MLNRHTIIEAPFIEKIMRLDAGEQITFSSTYFGRHAIRTVMGHDRLLRVIIAETVRIAG